MKSLKSIPILIIALGLFSCMKHGNELDFNSQLKKDIATIDTYLVSHGINAVADSSGVRYVIHTQGTGSKPAQGSKISVKYAASLLGSSQIFDKTDGAVFSLANIIAGWQYVLPKINKGSTFTLYVPSGLAFGSSGLNSVPSNANIVFEGELFDDEARLTADKAVIDHFLDSIQAPNIQKDTSGIRWVYSGTPGNGSVATQFSNVSVTYKGTVFKTNSIFDQQTSAVSFQMTSLIEGWQDALKLIPAGSTFTLYVPSGLAYGPAIQNYTGGNIPANSILVFDIHFISTN